MAFIVNLSDTYDKCLPTELSTFLNENPTIDKKKVSYDGKSWNVLVDVKSDESATFIRAESDGEFHIWNCIKHPSEEGKIKVFHFNGPLTSDYAIAYETTGQRFSKLLLEGEVLGPEASFQLAEKTADLAMRWIQQQKLEDDCKKLTGREFTVPKKVSNAKDSPTEPSEKPFPLAFKLAAIAFALFLAYKVATYMMRRIQNTDHLTGMANVQ
ncbi:hypothetical protein [Simkania sp.]|uniref:hypothetical protein n=1 Tax=Simkania sp. TaxID=34094 RepID=UPI003B525480